MSLLVDDIVVQPKEVVPGGIEASLSEAGISIIGANFGESKVSGTVVKTPGGVVMVDREPDTRTIVLKLLVREDADVTLPEAAARLESITALLFASDEWIRRDFHVGGDFGSILYHVSGEVSLNGVGGWQVGQNDDVTLSMVCDFVAYSTEEVEHGPFSTSVGQRQLVYELPASEGTARGLKRIRVTNEGDEDWRGLIWSEESRYYKPEDPTAEPVYLAKNLTPKGGAEVKTVSGAEVVQHNALTKFWVAVLGSEISGVGHMTHRGARKIWMRVADPGETAGNVQVRLQWRVLGASEWLEDCPAISIPTVDGWALIDLRVALPQDPKGGEDGWEWQLIARSKAGTGAIRIRDVYLLATEQYLVCRDGSVRMTPDAFAALDLFDQTSGALNGKSLTRGGVWATSGDATDFAVDATEHRITRTEKSDSGYTGRYAKAGSSELLNVAVELSLATNSSYNLVSFGGPLCRFADANHWFGILSTYHEGGFSWVVRKRIAGTVTTLRSYDGVYLGPGLDLAGDMGLNYAVRLRLAALQNGEWYAYAGVASDRMQLIAQGFDADLATGGSLATGGVGVLDLNNESLETLRVYDDFTAWSPQGGAVAYAGQGIELATDGCHRQHPTDDVWAPVVPDGFLPYDQPGGPSRGILIPSQGDLNDLADSGANLVKVEAVRSRTGHTYARA